MPVLSNQADFAAAIPRLATELVDTPAWGDGVQVRIAELAALDAVEIVSKFEDLAEGSASKARQLRLMVEMLEKSIVDDAGERIYGDGEFMNSVGKRMGRRALESGIRDLFEAAVRLNGMDAKADESAEGNSVAAPNGALPTG